MRRLRNLSLLVVFLAVLAAPTVASLVRWNPLGDIDEKRALAKKPKALPWAWRSLRQVPATAQAWDKYFSDNFGLRKLLLGTYRLLTVHVLRTSPNPAVVLGQSDGATRWLYLDPSATADGVGLESIQGKQPYSPAELDVIALQLRQMTAMVRASGAKLVIMVAPDKQSIYPEYLPPSRRPPPGVLSRLDQFSAMAATLTDVPVVDLRALFRQAKPNELLYFPRDTHWTYRAAWLAYEAAARALAAQDPSRQPLPAEQVEWYLGPPRVGDLTKLLGIPVSGGDLNWLPAVHKFPELGRPKRGKLLVIGDSFVEPVLLFFAPDFAEVKPFYIVTRAGLSLLTPALLAQEKPDVVLIECVERHWTWR